MIHQPYLRTEGLNDITPLITVITGCICGQQLSSVTYDVSDKEYLNWLTTPSDAERHVYLFILHLEQVSFRGEN